MDSVEPLPAGRGDLPAAMAPPLRQLPEDPLITVERLLADRDSELVDEDSWARYAEMDDEIAVAEAAVTLEQRMHASLAARVSIRLIVTADAVPADLTGVLAEVGDGWLRLRQDGREWVVAAAAITGVSGLRAGPGSPPPPAARRSWASVARALAGSPMVAIRIDGSVLSGTMGTAGRDYLEVVADGSGPTAVPYRMIAAIRRRAGR